MMEKVAEFNDNNGFKVTLTTDKIYISAIGAEETFALRSVSGVGLYDNIEKYNMELEAQKTEGDGAKLIIGIVGIIGGLLVAAGFTGSGAEIGIEGAAFLVFAVIYYFAKSDSSPPVLDSYFTLMLSGGDRRFPFNKSGNNAKQIAEFINKVEDTLTAYHKG
jgi:hypothetical protein